MADETDDRLHVVQDLFALITSLCEDAAGLALMGKGARMLMPSTDWLQVFARLVSGL
jgi:hypothetical protein